MLPRPLDCDMWRRRGMGRLAHYRLGVPRALLLAHPPHCSATKASVGPRLIFPDPFPVPDRLAAFAQTAHL
eukprot:9401240-Pyramimonas_sp.AAC.1